MSSIEEFKRDFLYLLKEKNLSHGYIFFGESPSDQFVFSQKLANYLENKEWHSPGTLVDVLFIEGREDSTGIDAIRTAINFLWLKPVKSSKRTLIINNAERLTIEAQNALLKISEEPPEHSLIILILKDPEVLVPTLISRFQKIYFKDRCEKCESDANDAKKLVKEFLRADYKGRKEIIKAIVEDSQTLTDFVKLLISELKRNPIKNHRALKELLGRWKLINQYNVNKKLQLEAALLDLSH